MEIGKDFIVYCKDGCIVVDFTLPPLEWHYDPQAGIAVTHGRVEPQPMARPTGNIYTREYDYSRNTVYEGR